MNFALRIRRLGVRISSCAPHVDHFDWLAAGLRGVLFSEIEARRQQKVAQFRRDRVCWDQLLAWITLEPRP